MLSLVYFFFDSLEFLNFSENFTSFRILRIVYALRILRLLRKLEYMFVILFILNNYFFLFFYTFLILFWIIFIYSLFGIQFFQRETVDFHNLEYQQFDFSRILNAVMTCFNIITLDNWYHIIVIAYNNANHFIIIIYLFSLIFIGNFIFLNLYMAIILDAFESIGELELDEEIYGDETIEILNKYIDSKQKKIQLKENKQFTGYLSTLAQSNFFKLFLNYFLIFSFA